MAKVFISFLQVCIVVVTAEAISCGEYGVGEVSECTDGFTTLFHIDKLAKMDNTRLETKDKRQVVIPDINFACNGVITSVVVGAEWKGNTNAYTDLQIWRRNSLNVYMKINGTSIMVDGRNDSEVYEIALNTPLAFMEGDILGYFQPDEMKSQLNLYLEKSGRITTYYTARDDLNPPATSTLFNISDSEDTRYPLIAVRTDPPDCGCGFMSVERVYALLNIPPLETGMKKDFDNRHMIFPNITFTCSGEVVKWIMARKWNNGHNQYPQLEIWRQSGGTTYERLNSTVISAASEEDDGVYEYPVDPPLPFQPGDILGVLQPDKDDSRLQADYDKDGDSVYYYIQADNNNDTFNINSGDVMTESDLPLITVGIVQYTSVSSLLPTSTLAPSLMTTSVPHIRASSTDSTSSMAATIATGSTVQTDLAKPFTRPPMATGVSTFHPTTTSRSSPDGSNSVSVLHISMGVAGAVLVLVAVVVIVISLTLCLHLKRKYYMNVESSGAVANRNYTYRNYITTSSNSAYGVTSRDEDSCVHNVAYGVSHKEVELSDNVAYGVTQKKVELREEVELTDNLACTTSASAKTGDRMMYDYVWTSENNTNT